MRWATLGFVLLGLGLGSDKSGLMASPETPIAVSFVAPERFTDADDRFGSGPGLRGTLAEIRRIIEASAVRVMALGDRLAVEVVDIDLAGFVHPELNFGSGLRVVNDATPSAFRLRYDLRRAGRRIASGEERISDINFLIGARAGRSGSFAYEEALLRDWARRRLAVP